MSLFSHPIQSACQPLSNSSVPLIKDFAKIAEHRGITARSRSTSAGASSSCRSTATDKFHVSIAQTDRSDLWRRFLDALAEAELEVSDVPSEESELTALLTELGFSAIERARLRRSCRDGVSDPVQPQPLEGKMDNLEHAREEGEVLAECVFLTGDFFGDSTDAVNCSVPTVAGEGVPQAALRMFDTQAETSSTHDQVDSIDDNVFLTGDFFGDDAGSVLDPMRFATVVGKPLTMPAMPPPPPAAAPLLNIRSQAPIMPPPAEAPAFESSIASHLPLQPLQYASLPEPMQQSSVGSLEVPKPTTDSQGLPSIGSWDHHLGTCRPCAYFGERGCESGANCEYCHSCPPGELKRRQKIRRSAQRRMRYMNSACFEQSA